ncbi:Fic/DOC family protein [Mariniblastus fucicola]|uniref:Fic/DOC family protein n=2 Tax=Mariniblastus fucicola TaxID=980251 RepID=A0A5B9PC52_9BACT|nr:Fic/DOC family protein [Mariniblastus fucicola]
MIELGDVKEWHGEVFDGLPPAGYEYYAGNFRQIDLNRPCLDYPVGVAGIQGSLPREVLGDTEALFSNTRANALSVEIKWPTLEPKQRAYHLAVVIGELVGRFIQIHPFRDGNGRMSRMLWAVALARFGVSPQCRIHPSPNRDAPKTAYGDLMAACMKGNFLPLQMQILRYLIVKRPTVG